MPLKETYLSDLHKRTASEDQTSLSSFTTDKTATDDLGTTIAVVTDPTGGIEDVCDELITDLGMPRKWLNEFRSLRSKLDIEDDVKRHNKAAREVGLEENYRHYLQTDEKAEEHVSQLASRVENGETITLVCFEKKPKWCHRHILIDVIQNAIDSES